MGFYAPLTGEFKSGPDATARVNAQKPNRRYKKPKVGKLRRPKVKARS